MPGKDIANGISTIFGYSDISQYEGRTAYSGPIYLRDPILTSRSSTANLPNITQSSPIR